MSPVLRRWIREAHAHRPDLTVAEIATIAGVSERTIGYHTADLPPRHRGRPVSSAESLEVVQLLQRYSLRQVAQILHRGVKAVKASALRSGVVLRPRGRGGAEQLARARRSRP